MLALAIGMLNCTARCHIDEKNCFTLELQLYAGKFVKHTLHVLIFVISFVCTGSTSSDVQ